MALASMSSMAAEPAAAGQPTASGVAVLDAVPGSTTASVVAMPSSSATATADGAAFVSPATTSPNASTQFIPHSMAAEAAARVEPAAASPAPVGKPKGSESLSAYMAGRWSIGQEQASRLVHMAHRVAAEHALDPLLLLAVAARESGFQYTGNAGSLDAEPNPKKVDPGTAHGLMQVAGRFHPDKMPVDARGRMRVTTDEENLDIGAQLLRENLSLDQGDVGRALQRYNGNLRDAGQRFARYVLKVRRDLQRVIRAE